MPERPLLILPVPGQPVPRRRRFGGGGRFRLPPRERQAARLTPQFAALQRAIESRAARLRTEATGIIPEEVLVLETVGAVEDFIVAVQSIPGMEWLGEIDEEDIPPDDDFFVVDEQGRPKPGKVLQGRIFIVFTNQQALQQLLALWERLKAGRELAVGLTKWRDVFDRLRDIRPWGVRDRLLETGVLKDWGERIAHNAEVVPCEIELWFRRSPQARSVAQGRVSRLVTALEGQIVTTSLIEDIAYHALLARLPIPSIRNLVEGRGDDIELVQCEQIQFFRAAGQMAAIAPEGERLEDPVAAAQPPPERREPIVALFDGLPLQNHRRLAGRLIVDDPDNVEASYPAEDRRHGTAMASLILHGDIEAQKPALIRPMYVRPILQPDMNDWNRPRYERVPESRLAADLLHRAVRRLFEAEGNQPAVASSVCIANLSIGIRDRLFDSTLSPLARLLDWLAWKYKVLFLVSSGNHLHPIRLGITRQAFAALNPQEAQDTIVRTVAADARNRRLLSPSEAVNVLTAGALHDDRTQGNNIPRSLDPYQNRSLPSPINAQGMGYRRAIKPELLIPGGRVVLQDRISTSANAEFDVYPGARAPGQRVAAPGVAPGDLGGTHYTRGTSNATALVSRAAAELYEVLQELRNEPGGDLIDRVPPAIWLKAMVVHGANWGPGATTLDQLLRTPANGRQFKEYLTRLLGYGVVDTSRVAECTNYRVTALGGGILRSEQSHIHRFLLPPSLGGRRGWRRLVITLAWFTPVNPFHRSWRRAHLWFSPTNDPLRIDRQQADWKAVQRGTVQHEIFEGERAGAFVDGDACEIQVSCRADAGALEDEVPYALAVTLEVAPELGIPIYEEIRARVLAARVEITPPQ